MQSTSIYTDPRKRLSIRLYTLLVTGLLTLLMVTAGGCEILNPNPGPTPITGSDSLSSNTPPVDNTPATVTRGAALFKENCERCHGANAQGTLIWEVPIQGRLGIQDIVRNGRRAMPAFHSLSDSAIASIELFLGTFPIDFTNKSGKDLFQIYCYGCHGDSGTGTLVFPGNIEGYSPIHDIVKNGRGDMLRVRMPDSLIPKIQEFLSSFPRDVKAMNGPEYFAHLCAGCHGANGEGTKRGYEIRNTVRDYATYVIRNGRPGTEFKNAMPKYTADSLSDTQLDQIITMLDNAPKPTSGEALYLRYCRSCHGADAFGGISEKSLKEKPVDAFLDAVSKGRLNFPMNVRNRYMPAWSGSELNPKEIEAIHSYVRVAK